MHSISTPAWKFRFSALRSALKALTCPWIAAATIFSAASLGAEPEKEFSPPKEVAPGIFEIGSVRLDKNTRTVAFPAKVQMTDGLLEYLLVTPEGPVHESLLVSDAKPQDVHIAMLLLGAKGMERKENNKEPERIDAGFLAKAPKLTGDRIFLSVKWKDADGKEHTTPPERWITRKVFVTRKPTKEVAAEDGPWLYTGSYFYENRFIAQMDGTFAALVTFPGALINNPREGSNNDQNWFANTKAVPPAGTPLEFSIKLEPADKAPEKPAK